MLHLFPQADVPVFQVPPSRLGAASAWAFGEALAPLAEDGVLLVCAARWPMRSMRRTRADRSSPWLSNAIVTVAFTCRGSIGVNAACDM
jgi:aromatic ring-opening dioxygenase catalytic subunit (LigB family)